MSRTENWQQDQDGMLATAYVEVQEPGDVPPRVRKDVVLVDYTIFEELMTGQGFARVSTP